MVRELELAKARVGAERLSDGLQAHRRDRVALEVERGHICVGPQRVHHAHLVRARARARARARG